MAVVEDVVGGPFTVVRGSGLTSLNYHGDPGEPSDLAYYDSIVGLEPWDVGAVTPITEPTITSGPIEVATEAEFAAAVANGVHLHVTANIAAVSIASKFDVRVTFANGVDYIQGFNLDASTRVYLDGKKPDGSRVRIQRTVGDNNAPIFSLGTSTDTAVINFDARAVHNYQAGLWAAQGGASINRAAIIGCTIDAGGYEQAVVWTTLAGSATDMIICDTIIRGGHAIYFHQYAAPGALATRVVIMDCWAELTTGGGGYAADLRSVSGLWVTGCDLDKGFRLSDATDTVDEVYINGNAFYGGAASACTAGTVDKVDYTSNSHAVTGLSQTDIDTYWTPAATGDQTTGNTFAATAALPTPAREPNDIPT